MTTPTLIVDKGERNSESPTMRTSTAHPGGQSRTVDSPATDYRRRTKIIATLGPATDKPGVLDALVAEGLDAARLNCSHGTADDIRRRTRDVRESADRAGRHIALILDLQGPKVRLGDVTPRPVSINDEIVFASPRRAESGDVVVGLDEFDTLITDRSQLVIGDGSPRFTIEEIRGGRVHARALTPGSLLPSKGVSVTDASPALPAITAKDRVDVDLAVELGADFVAQSFVRTADDVRQLRAILAERGSRARAIAKIETIEGAERVDSILAACDGVMVARGDYGVEAGVERVPLMQKHVIRRALHAGKVVITATQMLESMLMNAEPTRAEACDVANAVLDGTSAVMLSGETSVGEHPVQAVHWMAKIAATAERTLGVTQAGRDASNPRQDEAVMRAAVDLAVQTRAAALIVPTSTGGSARACSRLRPQVPIIALAHDPVVARQLALEWGVVPTTVDRPHSLRELAGESIEQARVVASLEPGAAVVLTAGQSGKRGTTNLILLKEVPAQF
jgi:pyruvate kinase